MTDEDYKLLQRNEQWFEVQRETRKESDRSILAQEEVEDVHDCRVHNFSVSEAIL
jgi:hypothetical protein